MTLLIPLLLRLTALFERGAPVHETPGDIQDYPEDTQPITSEKE